MSTVWFFFYVLLSASGFKNGIVITSGIYSQVVQTKGSAHSTIDNTNIDFHQSESDDHKASDKIYHCSWTEK